MCDGLVIHGLGLVGEELVVEADELGFGKGAWVLYEVVLEEVV